MAEDEPQATGQAITGRPTTECPFCKESILANASKCKHCGSTLDVSEDSSGPGHAKRGIVLSVLLLVALGLLASITENYKQERHAEETGRRDARDIVDPKALALLRQPIVDADYVCRKVKMARLKPELPEGSPVKVWCGDDDGTTDLDRNTIYLVIMRPSGKIIVRKSGLYSD